MKVHVNSNIEIRTPYYPLAKTSFYHTQELLAALRELDFMAPHAPTDLQVGEPIIQLGTHSFFTHNGKRHDSPTQWGPKFLIAENIYEIDDKTVYATIAVDCPASKKSDVIKRKYKRVKINPNKYRAILRITPDNKIVQLYPKHGRDTELNKFLTHWQKHRENTVRMDEITR